MSDTSEEQRREELLAALSRIEKSRPDKIGLAGDMVSTGIGVGAGVAASGTLAAAAGATTILGSSTLAGALGGVFVASTPVGWVIGAGLAGGALAYGATRLVRSGESADRTKENMYELLKARLPVGQLEHESVADEVSVSHYEIEDKDAYYRFVALLLRSVERKEIDPARGERLLAAVTSGEMDHQTAIELVAPHDGGQDSSTEISELGHWFSLDTYSDLLRSAIGSEEDPQLDELDEYLHQHVPVIWLLGKTGAGKSSLVAEITGRDDVDVGNGFEPCTQGLSRYRFPEEQPLMQFLDTRGLSEAGYVADEDIAEASKDAHAIIVVMKLDDPEQSAVIDTLSKLGKNHLERVIVVFTGAGAIQDDAELQRAANNLSQSIMSEIHMELPTVQVDFVSRDNVDELRQRLADLMPSAGGFLRHTIARSHEETVFFNHRKKVLWHSGAAASADIVPGVGLVAVPSIQMKMLYQLSEAYGLNWGKQEILEFLACLGGSFSVAYGSKMLLTQMGRLIPVWGQTIGQATAVTLSFGLTYAIGRGACYYMYQKRNGNDVDPQELKAVYEAALQRENLGLKESSESETAQAPA